MQNPNFPKGLNIKPSTLSAGLELSGASSVVEDANQFGASAQQHAIGKYGIAGRVWEAAYALNLYIDPPADWSFDPPFVLNPNAPQTLIELGSGTGIVGKRISNRLVPHRDLIIVTDLAEVCFPAFEMTPIMLKPSKVCPLLEQNLYMQQNHTVVVRPLAWGSFADAESVLSDVLLRRTPPFLTRIICSDLVYFPELLAPLLRSLIQLSSPPFSPPFSDSDPGVSIIISYKVRSLAKETPFWSAFGLWFSFEPVVFKGKGQHCWTRFGSLDDSPFIFVAHRRPASFSWDIPQSDQDLLQGVGACGTASQKSDDTFETILLMSMEDDFS
ncbi:hypothetical protein HGRIS_003345 [Hohenbuehelia grisea]|uniref:Methyltransferase-domain-containing protein n=1 Tax=Hohenbuehelia grisea TaxID=104357 RepID=A0ABR3JF37_9AGAR